MGLVPQGCAAWKCWRPVLASCRCVLQGSPVAHATAMSCLSLCVRCRLRVHQQVAVRVTRCQQQSALQPACSRQALA
jgi:hypothetical protein